MAAQVSFRVENGLRAMREGRPDSYDWGTLMKKRLCDIYGDMDIRIEDSEGDDVVLTVEFLDRPESVEEITDRIYGFMWMYPMMQIGKLKVKLLA